MSSTTLRELLRPAMFVNSALWLVLTASIFLYAMVAYLLAQRSPVPTDVPEALQLALTGIAILTGLGSVLVPRVLLSDDRIRKAMGPEPDPATLARHPKLGVVDEERLRRIETLSGWERKLLLLPTLYFTPFILRLALNEAIAIYGFVLAFVAHSFAPMLPFAAAAIILNLGCLPRIDPLLDRAARLAA
jgi:F0F1-type ATP synthase membrane subunit c/vacuolar-type H+-ATPase subunit K